MNLVKRTKDRAASFLRRLHKDESGPNTVEWVLLIVVALVVLIAIYAFIMWASDRMSEKAGEMDEAAEQPKFEAP